MSIVGNIRTAIIAKDFHVPFHNVDFVNVFIEYCKELHPDVISVGSDGLDCYGISKFNKNKQRAKDFDYERNLMVDILRQIRIASPKSDIIYIAGNHEERIPNYLAKGDAPLANMPELQIRNLLSLDLLGIKYVELYYKLNNTTIITHGTKCGINTAKGEANLWGYNGFSGHAHKDNHYQENFLDYSREWWSLGCMADISQLDYAARISCKWNNSFAIAKFDAKDIEVKIIKG